MIRFSQIPPGPQSAAVSFDGPPHKKQRLPACTKKPSDPPVGSDQISKLPDELVDQIVGAARNAGTERKILFNVSGAMRRSVVRLAEMPVKKALSDMARAGVKFMPQSRLLQCKKEGDFLSANGSCIGQQFHAEGPQAFESSLNGWAEQEIQAGNVSVNVAQTIRAIVQAYQTGASRLDIVRRNVHTLPDAVCQIASLRVLDVRHNALKELPKELIELPVLKIVYIKSNPLSDPVIMALGDGGSPRRLAALAGQSPRLLTVGLGERHILRAANGKDGAEALKVLTEFTPRLYTLGLSYEAIAFVARHETGATQLRDIALTGVVPGQTVAEINAIAAADPLAAGRTGVTRLSTLEIDFSRSARLGPIDGRRMSARRVGPGFTMPDTGAGGPSSPSVAYNLFRRTPTFNPLRSGISRPLVDEGFAGPHSVSERMSISHILNPTARRLSPGQFR